MENLLWLAFLAGIFSFLSPCIIPMITVYFSLITGMSVEELQRQKHTAGFRRRIMMSTVFFVLGFILIFTLAGGAAGIIGNIFNRYLPVLNIIGGTFIIFFGLTLLGVFKPQFLDKLNLEERVNLKKFQAKNRYLNSFLIGVFFAIACSHCIGPTLYSMLILAGATGAGSTGMVMMFIFSVGLALPYMAVAFIITSPQGLSILRRISKHYKIVAAVTGGIMIIFGFLMLTGRFTLITSYIQQLLPYRLPLGM